MKKTNLPQHQHRHGTEKQKGCFWAEAMPDNAFECLMKSWRIELDGFSVVGHLNTRRWMIRMLA
jgi:hypothetical protein